jgi:plasminogen activator inhibitor 1 RNA-binding protein
MNIFSVLDESDNEEPKPKVAEKKVKDNAKPAVAGEKKDAQAKPKAAETKGKVDAVSSAKPKTVQEKPKAPENADAVASGKDDNRGGRARGKEYREKGGRGGRGGNESSEGGERRPKRDFERRSGTGRGREVSKGGRGSFGFGNPAQDAQDAEKDPNSAEALLQPVDAEESAEPEVVAEPEPVTFTLDEFLEKRNQARQALNASETKLRKVDQSTLAGLNRKEDQGETTYMPIKAGKVDNSKKDQRSTGKTQVLDVAFKFAAIQVDEDRGGRGGRGGRGDGRGAGGRGGDARGRGPGRGNSRPASGKAAAFNTADFPSL